MLDDQAFFTALPLGFGLLHLILFATMPGQRGNLYYAFFLVFIAGAIYFDFQHVLESGDSVLVNHRFQRGLIAVGMLLGLRFFYDAFLGSPPRYFPHLAGALLVAGAIAVFEPDRWFLPLQFLLLVVIVEGLRTMTVALVRKREDAWVIAAGVAFFAAFSLYDLLLDFRLIAPFREIHNMYQYGLMGLLVGTSTYLARNMARTHHQLVDHERQLREQEVQRRLLAAEVARTTGELEEARALQLSMLPASVPHHADLELAAHMKTALEVGGDYYDFREAPDGTLTVAIGDATGHGLRAGMMVAIAKSLFQGLADDEELPAFFRRCTGILKPMRLGNLFMGLTVARIRGDAVTIAAAGMPPALVFRAATGEVEQVVLKGMPLGAFPDFPYPQARVSLGSGDTLLLLTDGLPETFNERREQLGMTQLERALDGATHKNPEDVVAHLCALAEAWRGTSAQQDDIALIAIRRRPTLNIDDSGADGESRWSRPS